MTEEQKIKCEEIINSYEERYKKEFEEINTLGFGIDEKYTSPILRIFDIIVTGISFFEFGFLQSEEYFNEYTGLLVKANNIAGKNIIDLTVSLSEVFKKNMTKKETEKLLFESNIKDDWQAKHSNKFYNSTIEFEDIIEPDIKHQNLYKFEIKIKGKFGYIIKPDIEHSFSNLEEFMAAQKSIFDFRLKSQHENLDILKFKNVCLAIANYFDK